MLLVLAVLALQAAPTDSAEAWLRREMTTLKIPGVAVAVIQGGKLVLERGLGRASVEGLPDFIADPNTGALIASSTDSAMARVRRLPMAFPTGTQWQYNQTNYFLLGALIRRLTGLTYPEYFAQRFFGPLGMTTTVLGDSRAATRKRANLRLGT